LESVSIFYRCVTRLRYSHKEKEQFRADCIKHTVLLLDIYFSKRADCCHVMFRQWFSNCSIQTGSYRIFSQPSYVITLYFIIRIYLILQALLQGTILATQTNLIKCRCCSKISYVHHVVCTDDKKLKIVKMF
jgi:hypothetical protein